MADICTLLVDTAWSAMLLAGNERKIRDIEAALCISLPEAQKVRSSEGIDAIGTAPGAWLLICYKKDRLLEECIIRLKSLASVSDQTGGYFVHELSGPDARLVLQSGAYIDLSARAFGPWNAAATNIAHIPVTIWRADREDTYYVALYRSYHASFLNWLECASDAIDEETVRHV